VAKLTTPLWFLSLPRTREQKIEYDHGMSMNWAVTRGTFEG
jgi:hypothetical protein